MKNIIKWTCAASLVITLGACNKTDFLNKKPLTNILTPVTLSDFQYLLDNTSVMNYTGGLNQLSSDDITVNDANWATASATERNAYIWARDVYAGDVAIGDWNELYQQVFYANSVLDGLVKSDSASTPQGQYIKGWALFDRAFAFYDLTRTFCKAYDASTASQDLGVPLKLKSGIDDIRPRATLAQTYDQLIGDLTIAVNLLPSDRPSGNLNRPSKIAAYALLARIYLDMRNYTQAEANAGNALALYSTLIDYNSVSLSSATPFSTTNDELIFNARQLSEYGVFTPATSGSAGKIPPGLINLYSGTDLRLPIFFAKLTDGTYYRKRGYYGSGSYSFTGLATDELYLIKAECLARDNQITDAMSVLNQLLVKRYSGKFTPLAAGTSAVALTMILTERVKELNWRGLRWYDLKRFNKEGSAITLSRVVNGSSYTLPPNDDRWAMPIPADELALSGIQQNPGR